MSFWITPILLVSGVGLLVLSTSARYGQLHESLHQLIDSGHHKADLLHQHLQQRAELLVRALFSLYVSIGLFALASLVGGIISFWTWAELAKFAVAILTCCGILCVLFAAWQLIKEAHIFLDSIEAQGEHLRHPHLHAVPAHFDLTQPR
ncbi:Protein of unknown function [Allopseudospirillum japonicum]|uniref:DUF2721 domain-containing protein n=1 Tax=Allopseudospirillum japonicum TaxID=64971 RepID=A0A1H6TNI1_9GAMM|nr:DUF2721 domain-containing protein [Allopseudospirillum japonicum]SEI81588.1 Protein of unknown function [Allopseudospirillum japonicum]